MQDILFQLPLQPPIETTHGQGIAVQVVFQPADSGCQQLLSSKSNDNWLHRLWGRLTASMSARPDVLGSSSRRSGAAPPSPFAPACHCLCRPVALPVMGKCRGCAAALCGEAQLQTVLAALALCAIMVQACIVTSVPGRKLVANFRRNSHYHLVVPRASSSQQRSLSSPTACCLYCCIVDCSLDELDRSRAQEGKASLTALPELL